MTKGNHRVVGQEKFNIFLQGLDWTDINYQLELQPCRQMCHWHPGPYLRKARFWAMVDGSAVPAKVEEYLVSCDEATKTDLVDIKIDWDPENPPNHPPERYLDDRDPDDDRGRWDY